MSDEFAICPKCNHVNTMLNITAEFPLVWSEEQLKYLNDMLLCGDCWTAHHKSKVQYEFNEYLKEPELKV